MPIQILPPQLANQIAAGEVVERPASVIKELLENSIDAGANKIEIDIEGGGSRLIRIRDNGKGIPKNELALALSRHATSKLANIDDLEAIASLGFRGEALASISSVSRLTLTSRPAEQKEGWQASAEGMDMQVEIKPAAHPQGTTIEVADLFFNTPARRRFLRTDKTEFSHIEEVVKRIVLSRFDLQIKLTHNGKIYKHYRAATQASAYLKRIAAVCGPQFSEHVVEFDAQYDLLHVKGWLGEPKIARSQRDLQYCYVNGRMMRDKLINHAIRQAFESRIASDQHAAYVLYIEIDPKEVDVNVHPAKHEVRFHQSRLVHDYIYQAIYSALNDQVLAQAVADAQPVVYQATEHTQASQPLENRATDHLQTHLPQHNVDSVELLSTDENELYQGQQVPSQFSQDIYKHKEGNSGSQQAAHYAPSAYIAKNRASQNVSAAINQYGELLQASPAKVNPVAEVTIADTCPVDHVEVLSLLKGDYLLAKVSDDLYVMPVVFLNQSLIAAKLSYVIENTESIAQPLLLPVAFKAEADLLSSWQQHQNLIKQLQLTIQQPRRDTLVIQKVPAILRDANLAHIIPNWLLGLKQQDIQATDYQQKSVELLAQLLLDNQSAAEFSEVKNWIKDYAQLVTKPLADLFYQFGQPLDYTINFSS